MLSQFKLYKLTKNVEFLLLLLLLIISFFAKSNELQIKAEFPEAGKVVLGKVDCDRETAIASRFHISKYPTLKIVRNGQLSKREYRGQRSAEAFLEFVKKQLEDPIKEFKSLKDLENLDSKKRSIIGYFDRRDQAEYNIFRKVATNLKEDCQFHVGFGEASQAMHPPGKCRKYLVVFTQLTDAI